MEAEPEQEATLFPTSVGEKLRAAREAQKLDLSEIAARTRIPQRHLEAIERSDYAQLPSITYALGFAKSYARAVGADEVAIGKALRSELGTSYERPAPVPVYDTSDPNRSPPQGLVWVGVVVALLVLVGAGIWYGTDWFRGSAPAPEPLTMIEDGENATANATAQPVPAGGGQVTLTALSTVWLRVSDAAGNRLFEKEMQPGERYDVPQDANGPRVRTGRADAIQVTLNGSNVPPLGPADQTVDVEVSAAALQARDPAAPATPTAGAPAPRTAAPRTRTRTPAPAPAATAPAESAAPSNATTP